MGLYYTLCRHLSVVHQHFQTNSSETEAESFHISTITSIGGETNNCYDLQDNMHMQYTVVRFVIYLIFDWNLDLGGSNKYPQFMF